MKPEELIVSVSEMVFKHVDSLGEQLTRNLVVGTYIDKDPDKVRNLVDSILAQRKAEAQMALHTNLLEAARTSARSFARDISEPDIPDLSEFVPVHPLGGVSTTPPAPPKEVCEVVRLRTTKATINRLSVAFVLLSCGKGQGMNEYVICEKLMHQKGRWVGVLPTYLSDSEIRDALQGLGRMGLLSNVDKYVCLEESALQEVEPAQDCPVIHVDVLAYLAQTLGIRARTILTGLNRHNTQLGCERTYGRQSIYSSVNRLAIEGLVRVSDGRLTITGKGIRFLKKVLVDGALGERIGFSA